MSRAQRFMQKGKCKNINCSSVSNPAWTDLNCKGNILTLHDKCPNPKSGSRKNITFTPHQYKLEGGSIKSKLQKIFLSNKKSFGQFY